MDTTELIALYTAAWGEPERSRRLQLLERAWTDDGSYTDPTVHLAGRTALVDHIGGFFSQFPGARLEVASDVDAHHDHFRFAWRMVLADGQVFVDGIDFAERAADGRLRRVVGFFGPLAPKA